MTKLWSEAIKISSVDNKLQSALLCSLRAWAHKNVTQLGWAGLGWAGLVGNGMGLQLKFRLTHRHRAAEAAWRESSGFGAKQDIDLAGLGTL